MNSKISDLEKLLEVDTIEEEEIDNQMSRPHLLYIVQNSIFVFVEHWQLHFGRRWHTWCLNTC